MHGYAGKILRVDLSSNTITEIPTADYAERFLGGRGVAAKIYWDEVSPKTRAIDEENRLIFALGPMAGIPVLGTSRWGVFGKSTLPLPEQFCYGNLGGSWGAELKFAGYDGIIIHGKSEKPVYLLILDGRAEIKDATALWGKGAIQTRNMLKADLGEKVKIVAIGPAGENLVSTATLLADNDASGSGGTGAIMGSKKLKAIAVKGIGKKTKIAHPEKLKELANFVIGTGKGNIPVWGLDFMVHGPRTKKEPCYGCLGNCIRVKYTADNGTAGKYMCQSRFFYYAWALGYYCEENDVPFHALKLCDDYGLDTWTLQTLLEWLCSCFNNGVLTEQQTGIPYSQIGSAEFIEQLVKMISLREGFGDLLAMGRDRAAEKIGPEATSLIQAEDAYEPRMYLTNALIFPFESREPIQQVHQVGLTLGQWSSWAKGIEGIHVSTDVLKAIAGQFWGGEIAADFSTYEGKALAAKLIQDREYVKESLMICDWIYPMLSVPNSSDHLGDPTLESRMLSAVLGKDFTEESLNHIGERVFNLQRAIFLREGHKAPEGDKLPDNWHNSPFAGHIVDPDSIVPGKNGEIISRKGEMIDWNDFVKMRSEYYQLRQWDISSGLQTRKLLEKVGLGDIVDDMSSNGLLA